jgi:HK97 family phage portal protein
VGLLDNLRSLWAPSDSYGTVTLWGTPTSFDDVRQLIQGQDPSTLYRQQPNLRTLISFLARNTAQLGVHTFERKSDQDRQRNTTDPAARIMARPNKTMTAYDLIYRLVADLALWDEAIWLVTEDIEAETGWTIQPIPMKWVQRFGGGDLWGPGYVMVFPPGAKVPIKVPMEEVMHFHGWDPDNLHNGLSPVEALKSEISEQIHAKVYREQQWTKAGRAGMVVSRPADAPKWTPDQKRKFKEVLDAKMSGNSGADAGGTLIFEDGMKGERLGFNAKENQFVEAAKLSFTVCCQVYHVNPTMVGMLDNANFSNVKEFRRMLYGETLGPILVQLEDRLNSFLMPRISTKKNLYYEFNVKEKLRGSFEEEGQILQAATGGPYMTRNEARARNNLSQIEGGDELIVPMNVTEGGQASPQDSTPDSITGESSHPGVAVKARASSTAEANTEKALRAFYKRQGSAVLGKLGAKADEWWDEDRWNSELAADLYKIAVQVSNAIGRKTAEELGYDPSAYDSARTFKFLQAVSQSRAAAINGTTKAALDEALASVDDEDGKKPSEVFKEAEEVRSVAGAAALVTCFSAFATTEAAKQVSTEDRQATKTWVVTSSSPRKAHSRMNGETVPVDQKFSNGAEWPGDPVLGSDGVAGCKCSVTVRMPA